MNLGKYNKLWVALIGAGVAVLTRHFGGDNSFVLDIEALLTAAGVWAAPNKG